MRTGKCQPVYKCCRCIRIQIPSVLGEIYYGYNTIIESMEAWKCIKVKKDYNNNIMQKVYKEGEET